MDASRKTGHTNAFFTGIGRAKRIVLFDSLLEKHTSEEIQAIFAHEAGHFKRKTS
jgi:STE24 endopeptidase